MGGPARQDLGAQAIAADPALDNLEHGKTGLHHLESDAVTGKDRDAELHLPFTPPPAVLAHMPVGHGRLMSIAPKDKSRARRFARSQGAGGERFSGMI
jgi:hypothetical protein